MENFDDVAEEVMMHDADDVIEVVRELVNMNPAIVYDLPKLLRSKVIIMRATFKYHEEKLHEKANQKRIIHRYGQAE